MDLPGSVLRDADRTESGVEKKRKVRHDTDKHTEMNLPSGSRLWSHSCAEGRNYTLTDSCR